MASSFYSNGSRSVDPGGKWTLWWMRRLSLMRKLLMICFLPIRWVSVIFWLPDVRHTYLAKYTLNFFSVFLILSSWYQTLVPLMPCWVCCWTAAAWSSARRWVAWRLLLKGLVQRCGYRASLFSHFLDQWSLVDRSFYNSFFQSKGYAIGNAPELARAHNSHAR